MDTDKTLRQKLSADLYDADPLSTWVEDLTNEERNRKSEAKWNMAVDRGRGIYRPKSSYGLLKKLRSTIELFGLRLFPSIQ